MEALLFRDTYHTAIDKYPVSFGTGSSYIRRGRLEDFLNSSIQRDDSTTIILKENNQDDNLIRLREKFNIELNKFQDGSKELAIDVFHNSLFHLSKISPEKITVEVTDADSLYFSIIKNDYTIYLEEYVLDGEVIVTLFENDIKQKSISGNIETVTSRLQAVTSY